MSTNWLVQRAGIRGTLPAKLLSVMVLLSMLLSGQGASPAHAASTLFVVPGGSTSGTCVTSWATGCTLQHALDLAVPGDQIWVKRGTYSPTHPFPTNSSDGRTQTFLLTSGVAIYGGFSGLDTVFGNRNPALYPSVLSGDINNDDGAQGNSWNNSYHVVRAEAGLDSSAELNGFTITAGYAYVHGNTIPGQSITDEWSGGGMYINGTSGSHSSPLLVNLTFTGNTAVWGGGLAADYSDSILTNLTFTSNAAELDGGGIANYNSSQNLTNVTFSGNTASVYNATGVGGAMSNGTNSTPTLTNVTFSGNSAHSGGAISGESPTIYDSIFWNDSPSEFANLSGAQLYDSIITGGLCPSGSPVANTCSNILSGDPLLNSLRNYGGFTPTLSLATGSSAINAGNVATCATTDQRGVTRLAPNAPCDIGAVEYSFTITITGNAGTASAILSYTDGIPRTTTAAAGPCPCAYTITVPLGWYGAVTPSKTLYTFTPVSRTYSNLQSSLTAQDYVAGKTLPDPWYGSVTVSSSTTVEAVARLHVGPEIMTYDGFASGSLTSYLPMLFKNIWGYNSTFYIQNVDAVNPANVTIKYYDTGGALTCTTGPFVLNARASINISVPSGSCIAAGSWVGGAVVTATGANIVAVGQPYIGAEIMTYNGFASGSTTAYLPMLFKNAFGGTYDSAFYIQDVDPVNTATIAIDYYDTNGNHTCGPVADTITSLSSHGVWVPSVSCLPVGWVGGVVITSNHNIVAVGRPHIGGQVSTYDGFSSGSFSSYAPMLFKNGWMVGYDSAFYIQNVDPNFAAHVLVRYYDTAGNLTCTKPVDTILPLSSHGYWVPDEGCLPAGWVGGAIVTSDRVIVTVGRPHISGQVTTYDGFAGGTTSVNVPVLFTDTLASQASAFYIQNTNSSASANVTINYYDTAGVLTCGPIADTIGPLSSHGYWVPSVSNCP